ncbi:hypothetical protein BGX27_000808, partial [Mortierella sp. AM989]
GDHCDHESFANEVAIADMMRAMLKPHYATILGKALSVAHHTVFIHGDLMPQNIIAKDGVVKAAIGWVYAGCYLKYWSTPRLCTVLNGLMAGLSM